MATRRRVSLHCESEESASIHLPAGTPAWISSELVEQTLKVWQPRYSEPLSVEDAIAILTGASGLMRALAAFPNEASSVNVPQQEADRKKKPK